MSGPVIPAEIIRILRDTYKGVGIRIWWQSRHRGLDGFSPQEIWPIEPDAVLERARRTAGL